VIQGLVRAAAARLRAELAAVLPAGERVAAGPVADPAAGALPLLVVTAGRFETLAAQAQGDEGGPRPREVRQRIDPGASAGPYRLDHAPLPGTARGRLVLAEGTVAEAREALAEGGDRDFTIDGNATPNTVALRVDLAARRAAQMERIAGQVQARVGRPFSLDAPKELSEALFTHLALPPPPGEKKNAQGFYSTARPVLDALAKLHPVVPLVIAYRELKGGGGAAVLLDYAFAGVFAERGFRQGLDLDAFAATAADAERWASLASASLLTAADRLLAEAASDYASRGPVSARHELTRMDLVDGLAAPFKGGVRMRISFSVRGKLTFAREEAATFGILRHVRSPGVFSADPVAVEPDIG
jgi:hypothetical protein